MNAFKKTDLNKILFLDIETVPQESSFNNLDKETKELWEEKSKKFCRENLSAEEVYNRAGILAEFGKIICISAGYIKIINKKRQLRIKTFSSDNEKEILEGFTALVKKHFNKADTYMCAHNGKEFDFPYIARRCLINGVALPENIDTRNVKPWDVKHFDTLDLWRFGDFKNYTSLKLLTKILNIDSPKDDIDGSQVYKVYWEEKNLKRIVEYCQKDVIAVAQVFLKFREEKLLEKEEIVILEK